MHNKTISVIIPCYNSGEYLKDAVESVKNSVGNTDYDIIIINDGSTDIKTINLLKSLHTDNVQIIHQNNEGPASARNKGICKSNSKYILFLDSDNILKPEFIILAINKLENNPEVDIIHGKPEFFGNINERNIFTSGPFKLNKILLGNYIDICSVVRRNVLIEIGLLDENPLLIGHEDWELWIRAGIKNKKFYFINKVLFKYRIRENSLITQATTQERFEEMIKYIFGKNYNYFQMMLSISNGEKSKPFRTFLKNIYHKYLLRW